jgi:N-acetylglutamate synthase-like GNAT family acetyltransferase
MDPTVIDDFIRRLEDLGLVGLSQESGIKEWKDFCVVEELMGLRARCGWISYDDSERSASFVDSA